MAQRSQPAGHEPSPVIALLKDADRGAREVSLKPGSHGVLLTLSGERATRRSADGRWPITTGNPLFRSCRPPGPGLGRGNRSTAAATRTR
jgi:hypothetical protein